MVFGGQGEDAIDPDLVEVAWPGYPDGYDDSGYFVSGLFDPVPVIPEQSYGSLWYRSSVLVDDSLILSCGGGYPATSKCFGLDLATGEWQSMADMNNARSEKFFCLVQGDVFFCYVDIETKFPF